MGLGGRSCAGDRCHSIGLRQLKAAKSELDGAMEGKFKAKPEAADVGHLAKSLRLKLDNAEREIQRLNEAAAKAEARASSMKGRSPTSAREERVARNSSTDGR
jgi:hypothetical protein